MIGEIKMVTSFSSGNITRLLFGLPAVFKDGYWIVLSSDFQNLARIQEDRANLAETYTELVREGFISLEQKDSSKDKVVHVTLIITNDCNLRCRYCFVDAGDCNKKVISLDTISSSLQHAVKIAKGRKLSVAFFGGEPTTQFSLIKKTVKFAKEISQENRLPFPEFSIISNGVFNKNIYEFLVKNNFLITLSVDGPIAIQDFQRPSLHGGSSRFVERTIKRFAESGYQIKIRVTVTEFSVHKMDGIVSWYSGFGFKNPEIHFESVSISGRARSLSEETGRPAVNDFIDNLKKAIERGNVLGVGVINSSFMNLMNSPSEFCDSNTDNRFAVTPDGSITRCVEVQDSCHPAAKSLFLGGCDKGKESDWQIIKFKSGKGDDCSVCFAKNVCGGGCPVRNFHTTGEIHTVDPYRCKVTREIIPYIYGMIDETSSS